MVIVRVTTMYDRVFMEFIGYIISYVCAQVFTGYDMICPEDSHYFYVAIVVLVLAMHLIHTFSFFFFF